VQGRPVGALTCYSTENQPLTESDFGLLTTVADQVAVAVENMRLYAESRDLAALEERARLARELHDSVTQALFSMTLHTRAAEMALAQEGVDPEGPVCRSISQLHDLTRGALAEMRALIFELRPGALQEEGLVEAVRKHVAAVSAREGVNITVEAPEERVPLKAPVEEHLYRVVQEAVHNVVKHAAATNICIRLHASSDQALTLEVVDDGVGFDTEAVPPGHLGLSTMAGRIQQIAGSLHIISSPGQGTTVRAVVPCAWLGGEVATSPPTAAARGAA
jgi:signal transduction histidine kinase